MSTGQIGNPITEWLFSIIIILIRFLSIRGEGRMQKNVFVGRERELQELIKTYAQVQSGTGQVRFVTGQALCSTNLGQRSRGGICYGNM